MKKYPLKSFIIAVTSLFAISSYAANRVEIDKINTFFDSGNDVNAILAMDANYHFEPEKTVVLPNGKVKQRLQQYYQNVPVWNVAITTDRSVMGVYSNISGTLLDNVNGSNMYRILRTISSDR